MTGTVAYMRLCMAGSAAPKQQLCVCPIAGHGMACSAAQAGAWAVRQAVNLWLALWDGLRLCVAGSGFAASRQQEVAGAEARGLLRRAHCARSEERSSRTSGPRIVVFVDDLDRHAASPCTDGGLRSLSTSLCCSDMVRSALRGHAFVPCV